MSGLQTPLLNRIDGADGIPFNYLLSAPVVGDFNNDGNTDFLAPWRKSDGSPILQTSLGRGDGTLVSAVQTSLPKGMTFGAGGRTSFLGAAVADFNGDTKQDVVFLTTVNGDLSSSYISYFAGKGDGSFSAPTNVALPNSEIPIEIKAADFNHDGKPDMAVLCEGGDILVYLGKGDGTFQDPVISITGAPQNSGWMQFLVGDVNNDGFPDLLLYAVNDYVTYSTSIMQGNGDGSFKSPVIISALSQQQSNQQFILADLNGDGNLDIVADLNKGSQVLFLAGDGKGGFANAVTSVTLPTGFEDQSEDSTPALIDLNGDGKLDMVFSYWEYTQGLKQTLWAQGNGDGTFQTPNVLISDGLWGVFAVTLSSKTAGLFAPLAEDGSGQAASVLYLPTKLPEAIEVSQAAVDFGQVNLGTGSSGGWACYDANPIFCPYASVLITNRGTAALDLSSIATDVPFSQLNDCPAALPVGQSCMISAEFEPQNTGVQTGILSISNGTSINPFPVVLFGTGATPIFSIEPASLTFSSQKVGTISSAQTFTLTNLTDAPQYLEDFRIATQYDTYFLENDNCANPVTKSCTISIEFAPLSPGAITATLEVWDQSGNLTAGSMSGTAYSAGPAISISPSSLDFGTPFIGTNVTPQSVTLTNTGDAPLLLTSVTAGTGFTTLNACGSSIQPGGSCAVGVFVDTSATGAKNGTLTITDNAPNSPQTVTLKGNVQSLSVAASSGSSTSATMTAGGTATYSLTVTPVSGFSGTIAVGCSNVPAGFSCAPSPASLTSDGKNPLGVTFTVSGGSTAAAEPARRPFGALPTVLSLSVLIFLLPKSMRDRARWLVVILALAMPFATGCGGSKKSTPATPTIKSYTLAATFASGNGGLVQVPLKLTVQN